jgi:hypothetical protein
MQESTKDVLALAELEQADAVMRAPDVDPLIFKMDPPLPLPPYPPASGREGRTREHQG